MNQRFYNSWKKYIHNLDDVLEQMQQQSIIAVGVAPYQRIIPALFLPRRSYQVYSVRNSADVTLLRNYAYIYCLEEKAPKIAAKVQSTGYLLKNNLFQGFLNSRQDPYTLLFYQATPPIVQYLNENNIPWIGNDPKTFDSVFHKEDFRKVLEKYNLPHLPSKNISKEEFLSTDFNSLYKLWQRPFVCQPGDYEISGGNFFIHTEEDLAQAKSRILSFDKFERVSIFKLSPFVVGDTVSMLGCITDKGILTSPLQLQLIDVPESLHGNPPGGTFFGHDWGFRSWSESAELDAQTTVEKIGKHLVKNGYKGIFGVDFIHDKKKDLVYPLECNPRFTGAIPVYSMINLLAGAPPIDFFTLASYLKIGVDFDFEAVNELWKKPIKASHIALTPLGIDTMKIELETGIYTYDEQLHQLSYVRPGAFLHELNNDREFIIIDQVPQVGQTIAQGVPRLFKFIFPTSIAESSKQIKPLYRTIIDSMSDLLRS
jgi:predicted ATP-grasp superfamily ATP-dependent carboligase